MRLNHARLVPNAKFENRTYTQYDPNARTMTQMPFNGYQGVFTATTTWNPPITGNYEIHCVGGGGGGASYYGAPGGGGNWASSILALDAGTTYTITIGALGARAVGQNADGGAGGTTSFGALLSAAGGGGGGRGAARTGGSGGSGGGGGMRSDGQGGGPGGYDGSNGATASPGGAVGTGQLGVAWGLGTNERIPAGGAGASINGNNAHPSGGFGGRYRGIYEFGAGRGGNYSNVVSNWNYASGRGCGGGAGPWFSGSAGDGLGGMVVWRLVA